MAEVTRLTGVARTGGFPGRPEQQDGQHPRPKPPRQRSERNILDAGSVLGIPRRELTPKVLEALAIIMDEMDRLRWDLEVIREVESRLEVLADGHSTLPVLNRRAFLRELTKMATQVERTEIESTLLYVALTNADEINRDYGLETRNNALSHLVKIVKRALGDIDIVGEIGATELGVILNLSGAGAAEATAASITGHLARDPLSYRGAAVAMAIGWGLSTLVPGEDASAMVAKADADMRARTDFGSKP